MESISVSFPLAFAAGLVSFLSPCVFPLVPSYLALVSGLSLDELTEATTRRRVSTLMSAVLFVAGFTVVFMTLGAAATGMGRAVARALPWIQRIGGVLIIVLGLYLVGAFRSMTLARERRFTLGGKPMGGAGVFLAGVVFGAGWTPCIGPVLATILLLAGLEGSVLRGSMLLGTYAVGLGVPFLLAALGVEKFLKTSRWMRRWSAPLQRLAGTFLVVVGLLLVTGRFQMLTASLAQMGQFITLEP